MEGLVRLQQYAYNVAMAGYNLFLTGDAGTGKSHTLNKIVEELEKSGKNVMITATTGVAAIHINGVTAHRAFKAPAKLLIGEEPRTLRTITESDVIILEEVSMCRIDLFEFIAKAIINANAQRAKINKAPIQFIVVGDFSQLPPVVTDRDAPIMMSVYGSAKGFAFQSKYWEQFKFISIMLNEVIRQKDVTFIQNLNRVKYGDFGGLHYFNYYSSRYAIDDAIMLCGTNKKVKEKNDFELDKLDTELFTFEASIVGIVNSSDVNVDEILELKVGARVMTLVNHREGLYQNGSLGTIREIKPDEECIIVDMDNGYTVSIGLNTWETLDYKLDTKNEGKDIKLKKECIGTFTQYPLKLAYAITIHKSQGQTYDKVNLNPFCWDCGQLYTALSRVKTIDGLYVEGKILNKYLIVSEDVKDFYRKLFTAIN